VVVCFFFKVYSIVKSVVFLEADYAGFLSFLKGEIPAWGISSRCWRRGIQSVGAASVTAGFYCSGPGD